MSNIQNQLLASLYSEGMGSRLEPYLRTIELQKGQVLAQPLEPLRHVYFPHSGIVSFVVSLKDGHLVQTAVVGRDGVVGALQAMDGKVTTCRVITRVAGTAAVIEAERVAEIVQGSPGARSLIMAHEQFFLSEVQLSAACNAVHSIYQRVCRWLLRMNDLVGINVAMTQELLAEMIGVARTSVTLVTTSLQAAGVIRYRRGRIEILNLERLKELSCECYQTLRDFHSFVKSN